MTLIVKNTTLIGPFDLIAPHTCRCCGRTGEVLCIRCKKYINTSIFNKCPNCKADKSSPKCPKCLDFPPCFIIGPREDLLATLIHDFKYYSIRAIGVKLAELMADRLPDFPDNTFIVPLPTATHHIRERGFDHTYYVAKRIAKLKHIKVARLFVRTKNTVQVGADKTTRELQAEQAFMVKDDAHIDPSATYILFDDVWTTGASMKTAVKKLRETGAKKIVIALLANSSLD